MTFILGGFKGIPGISINRLHPQRFEDLIERRGWVPVLWERAIKCACYSEDTGNPDPKDPTCGGIGWTYMEDLDVEVANEPLCIVTALQTLYTLKASLNGSPNPAEVVTKVSLVRNITQGVTYTVSSISGRDIVIAGAPLPALGDSVLVTYTYQREAGATVKAVITNVDYQKDFIPMGEWLQGDSIMTVSGQYQMGLRDRITIPEQVVRTSELKRRNELDVKGRSLERLRYKSGIKIFLVRDLNGTFAEGPDFTLGPDSTIVWGAGNRPKHKAFRLKYSGNATTATVTVSGTTLTTTLTGQTDGTVSLSVSFATYPTAKEVVDFINAQDGYEAEFDDQSNRVGIDNAEVMSFSVPLAATNIKAAFATVSNEDRTQYTIEYMHHLSFTIYTKRGMDRRHDDGAVLPAKYWLRLWEHTDSFSNDAS